MTTTETKRIRKGYEPIPGYVLEEVIGRGGFGEVWRASAPGGLKKAVKFVFGTQDQSRAARELRSLERIKGVQHPFLLTLERFEAVDDQLLIVTELADCSLEDIFKRNRDRGSCGIPRDALISHLHDTADALDYLHERYQLQHLDIKPGNLLMVGGHVKVADFGLLKDLREAECSVVGGLTPIYAPPEIFDGRPSMHSDQYSLAVMYQEMLTGTRPFSGRTIAQLATQHVHSAPNLEPLPPSDRPVIARALEKNPERRFLSCKAFVEALRSPRGRSTAVTCSGDDVVPSDTKPADEGMHGAASVEQLPSLTTGAPAVRCEQQHHAMVVALGGTGAECLRELRRRAGSLHAATPIDLHSVLIDIDMATIDTIRVAELSDRIPSCQTIYTPLRTAHEYRETGTERLRTISRRWIYNVPRSRSTEGMRPLGRLALVDHGPTVTKQLSAAIDKLATSSGQMIPSVYVVGSLTGGTSSGMYIDVVHVLRSLLDQAGLVEAPILSMLTTSAIQGDPGHPLALHDTQAAITEMRHFLQAGNGYPGDEGAQWPSVPAARTPLRDVYLVADATRGSLSPTPVETITEYIWSDATGAGPLLADARKLEIKEDSSIVPPSLRTVGIVPLGDSKRLERKVLAPAVVRGLLIQWLGLPSKARQIAIPLADRIMRRIGLSADELVEEAKHHLSDGHVRQHMEQAASCLSAEQLQDRAAVTELLKPEAKAMIADGRLPEVTADYLHHLRREMSVCMNDRRADATTVIECLSYMREKLAGLVSQPHEPASPEAEDCAPATLLDIAAEVIVSQQIEQLRSGIKSVQERLEKFATTIAMAIVHATKSQSSETNPWDKMPEPIRSEFSATVLQLHGSAANRYLIGAIGQTAATLDAATMVNQLMETAVPLVTSVLIQHGDALAEDRERSDRQDSDPEGTICLASTIQSDSHTQTAVTQAMQSVDKARATDEPLSIEDALVAVKPSLLAFGGHQRLILVVGTEYERSQFEARLQAAHDGPLTVAVVPGSTPKLIHEAQQIELANILSRLEVLNGGNTRITSRLSSRVDISW